MNLHHIMRRNQEVRHVMAQVARKQQTAIGNDQQSGHRRPGNWSPVTTLLVEIDE